MRHDWGMALPVDELQTAVIGEAKPGLPIFTAKHATDAADAVFSERDLPGLLPADTDAARSAVDRLSEPLGGLPPKIRAGLAGAESSAPQLSADRLQGLAEILQNADGLGASEVRFHVDEAAGERAGPGRCRR